MTLKKVAGGQARAYARIGSPLLVNLFLQSWGASSRVCTDWQRICSTR